MLHSIKYKASSTSTDVPTSHVIQPAAGGMWYGFQLSVAVTILHDAKKL